MIADLVDRLRLIRTPGIGPVAYRALVERFGSAGAAIDAVPDLARRGRGKIPQIVSLAAARDEIERVEAADARFIAIGEGDYPLALARIDNPPPLLTVRGDTALLARPLVAIVGARNASAAACRFARMLAHDLGGEGVGIVSGLARGIDSAAHDGSIERGTIAVVAGGIDVAYPPENAARQDEIAARGLVIAEMPPGTEPIARHFPYRNRIIAGLAAGTVVVEAAPKSGSLITARLAAEMGREVMAVPGSPLDPRAQGCNLLIRDGATLIQSAADVIEALGPVGDGRVRSLVEPYQPAPAPTLAEPDDTTRARIVELLGPSPVPVDELVRLSGAAAGEVQLVLLELELAGRIDRHAGGRVALRGA